MAQDIGFNENDVRLFTQWTLGDAEYRFNTGRLSSPYYEAYRYLWEESHGYHVSWATLPDDTRKVVEEYRRMKGVNL